MQKQFVACAEQVLRAYGSARTKSIHCNERIKSNDAHPHRDRIFLGG
jgi:hypothetical protein